MRDDIAISTLIIFSILLNIPVNAGGAETGARWYAGTWDSKLYMLREHPKTVAIRMEILDKDTHIPVRNVRVSLEGDYFERWISQDIAIAQESPWWGDIFVDPNKREPQPKEFKLEAISDQEGVVVFALQWQKEFPWDTKIGDKWTYNVNDEWLVYLDDIEKVQRLEIRHPRYKYIEAPLDFKHVADPAYYVKASKRGNNRYKLFENNWKKEIRRRNVKMFVLVLGEGLKEYNKQFCTRPEFFSRIRSKSYGEVYRIPENLPNLDDGKKCGPYFVYDLGEILLERVAQQLEVSSHYNILTREPDESNEPWYSQYSGQQDRNISEDASTRETILDEEVKTATTVFSSNNQKKEAMLETVPIETTRAIGGIVVKDLEDARRKEINLVMGGPMAIVGVEIVDVDPSSQAYEAGLRKKMIVTSIKRERAKIGQSAIPISGFLVKTPTSKEYFEKIFSNFVDYDQITLSVWRQSEGNTIRPGYVGSEEKGKWYRDEISFSYELINLEILAEAIDLYRPSFGHKTDYEKAKNIFLDLYKKGDPLGTMWVARCYNKGRCDFEQDENKAHIIAKDVIKDIISLAKNQESEYAMFLLGSAYQEGLGVNEDLEEAIKWYRKAADAGNPDGMYNLGYCLLISSEFHRFEEGHSWIRKGLVLLGKNVQKRKAEILGYPIDRVFDLGNGITIDFVFVPRGEFDMGALESDSDRRKDEVPLHRCVISKSFYMSKYEITRNQFQFFTNIEGYRTDAELREGARLQASRMGTRKSNSGNKFTWFNPGIPQTPTHPVVAVSWFDANMFCKWLSKKLGKTCRLPSEAEWEYACRAGTHLPYNWGDHYINWFDQEFTDPLYPRMMDELLKRMKRMTRGSIAWHALSYKLQNDDKKDPATEPVGKFYPNGWGLFDMHGNVAEWCLDFYDSEFYKRSPLKDPIIINEGDTYRVIRGGDWAHVGTSLRSSSRSKWPERDSSANIGFRVVMEIN